MSGEDIPFVDLRSTFAELLPHLMPDLLQLFQDGDFIGGARVSQFEQAYADYVGVDHCIGVGNGTDAVELALRAVGVDRGDEVILPANTFIATAEAVTRAGARPILVDVDADTLLMDIGKVPDALSRRTRAIVPVHLFGQVAQIDQRAQLLRGKPIAIVEDAAQAQGAMRHGRRAGSLGAAGATSFYPGKNLGAAGDAGAVTTNDPQVARRVRLMRDHGSIAKYEHEVVGWNSRLDAIQAVVLSHKLPHLDEWNERRRQIAQLYLEIMADISEVSLPRVDGAGTPVWHLFVIQVPHRDEVVQRLRLQGIASGIHYPRPVHLTTAFSSLGYTEGRFPVAEAAAKRILSLPMHPHLTDSEVHRVAEAVRSALARKTASGSSQLSHA